MHSFGDDGRYVRAHARVRGDGGPALASASLASSMVFACVFPVSARVGHCVPQAFQAHLKPAGVTVRVLSSGLDPVKLSESLKDDAEHEKYMAGVRSYEQAFNASGGGRVRGSAIQVYETEVSATRRSQFVMKENLGCFWPSAVYLREKGEQPPKERLVRAQKGGTGKMMVGIILDDSHGNPIGSFKLENARASMAAPRLRGCRLRWSCRWTRRSCSGAALQRTPRPSTGPAPSS